MDNDIDPAKLKEMRIRIMKLESNNAYSKEYSQSSIQKKIADIIEEVAFDDN